MRRWPVCVVALAAALTLLLVGCGRGNDDSPSTIADRVLRLGEDAGTSVETHTNELPAGLDKALNPSGGNDVKLPVPPKADLKGSARVTRPDGVITFFVLYQLQNNLGTVEDAVRGLLDETPWQVVGGQSSEGLSAFRFQSTRSSEIVGTAVVQPLPATDQFKVVVKRAGKNTDLTVKRNAFTPIIGAELQERNGAVEVGRVGPGEAEAAGLQQGDQIVKIGNADVKDLNSLRAALTKLGTDEKPVTSLVYIVQSSPGQPITPTGFTLPAARPLPKGFPAQFLVRNGMTPISVQWSNAPEGSSYQITFVTKESGTDVAAGLRDAINKNNWKITKDEAQGAATNLEFGAPDSSASGAISIDAFAQDNSYTSVVLQLQAQPKGS